MWYGQSERTRQFGTFPRSCVYVHSKSAISAPSPQISSVSASPLRPTLPPVGIPPTYMTSQSNSRISLPVKGKTFLVKIEIFGFIESSISSVVGNLESLCNSLQQYYFPLKPAELSKLFLSELTKPSNKKRLS